MTTLSARDEVIIASFLDEMEKIAAPAAAGMLGRLRALFPGATAPRVVPTPPRSPYAPVAARLNRAVPGQNFTAEQIEGIRNFQARSPRAISDLEASVKKHGRLPEAMYPAGGGPSRRQLAEFGGFSVDPNYVEFAGRGGMEATPNRFFFRRSPDQVAAAQAQRAGANARAKMQSYDRVKSEVLDSLRKGMSPQDAIAAQPPGFATRAARVITRSAEQNPSMLQPRTPTPRLPVPSASFSRADMDMYQGLALDPSKLPLDLRPRR